MNLARTERYRTQSFRLQYEYRRTLWSEDQIQELEKEILDALESEFGRRTIKKPKPVPLQREAGWFSEPSHNRGGRDLTDAEALPGLVFDGLRICRCFGCGQRIAWRPSFGVCACSDSCIEKAFAVEARKAALVQNAIKDRNRRVQAEKEALIKRVKEQPEPPKKRYYVTIAIDPVAMGRIVESLQRQLSEHHNVQADFIRAECVRGKWSVLEFNITNGSGGSLHIVLNGSGPGRAAWTLGAISAEQAVARVIGRNYSHDVGIPHAL